MGGTLGLRLAILGIGAFLAWRVVQVNAVIYGEENRPVSRIDAGSAAVAVREALRRNPADAGALEVFARRSEEAGDPERARRAHDAALAIAPVDRGVLLAAAAFELRRGRGAEALVHLDRLAEWHPPTRDAVFPVMAALADSGAARALLLGRAARAPWMGAFIEFACGRRMDPQWIAGLLLRRLAAGAAQRPEKACAVEGLRETGRWADAYQLWLNTLPRSRLADVGFVFNGGFEYPTSGWGFDWRVGDSGRSMAVDFAPGPGVSGDRALRVAYSGGRLATPALQQYLALDPGEYTLTGRSRLESLQSVRGVWWIVRCAGAKPGAAPLGASARFLGSGEWEAFRFEVTVPASCPGQVLGLEPVGLNEGTTFVNGRAWFDDLRLARSR